jgi:hypothetical protein
LKRTQLIVVVTLLFDVNVKPVVATTEVATLKLAMPEVAPTGVATTK